MRSPRQLFAPQNHDDGGSVPLHMSWRHSPIFYTKANEVDSCVTLSDTRWGRL